LAKEEDGLGPERRKWSRRRIGDNRDAAARLLLPIDVQARLIRMGEGEIKIDGQVLKFDGSESLLRMD